MAGAVVFTEFDTVAGSLVSTIKAAIVAQSDWSNITGDIVKCTTDGGADMIVNLAKAAGEGRGLTTSFWRLHDGTTGTNESITRYVRTRATGTASGTASTDPIHVVVAAGKNHLVITLEGARPGTSANAENPNVRDFLIMSDIVLYRADETIPCIFMCARDVVLTSGLNAGYRSAYVSRNRGGTTTWQLARVATMSHPGSSGARNQIQHISDDGVVTVYPWLVIDNVEGLRGRLRNIHYGGMNYNMVSTDVSQITPGVTFTYGSGVTWIAMPIIKNPSISYDNSSPFWQVTSSGGGTNDGPLLIVPFSGNV